MPFKFDAVSTTPFVIPSQLMKHTDHLPSFNCVMYDAATKTDDRIQVQRVMVDNEDALKFRFKSEVGGPFGKVSNPWLSKLPFVDVQEEYSDYSVILTASGKIYLQSATDVTNTNKYLFDDDEALNRMVEIVSGAFKCYAAINALPGLSELADALHNGRSSIKGVAGLYLPPSDSIKSQTDHSWKYFLSELAKNGFGDADFANF